MPFILITSLFLVLTIGTMQYTKQNFGVCLSANVFGIILITYLCAFTNNLLLSSFLIRGLFVVDFVWCVYHMIQSLRKKCSWNIPIVESIFFVALMAFLWFLLRGRMYSDWDEFSFWGSSLKFTMYNDVLYTSKSFDNLFKSYPPAQILFQYNIMKTLGMTFREDVAIVLASIPVIGVVMYPISLFIQKKNYVTALIGTILLMLCPTILELTAYTKTVVDLKLGILVAFLIVVTILPAKKATKITLLSLASAVLTLYKTTGFGLAILALLFCGIHFVLEEKSTLKTVAWKKKTGLLLVDFLPIITSIIVQMSWKYHITAQEVFIKWNTKASFSDIFRAFTGQASGYRATVLQKFSHQFFTDFSQGAFVKFPPFVWGLICLLLVAFAIKFVKKEEKNNILYGGISSIAIYAIFTISLLYSYLFVFEEIEATRLASFYRYLNSGILAMIMVSVVALLWACSETDKPILQIAFCLPCVLLLSNSLGFYGFWNIVKAPAIDAAQTHHDRYLYIRTARYIRQLGENPRLYLITANDSGMTKMLVDYELLPDTLPPQNTMLAANKHKDPAVLIMSAEEWSKLLFEEYDYVYIHCPETQFVADYLSVFEDESQVVVDRMFEVIRQPDGTAKLRRIEMVPEDGYVS